MLRNLTEHKIVLLLIYFIALQPFLDILTTISIIQLNLSATAGVLIRFLYMACCGVFLLSQLKKSRFARYLILYFAIWGLFVIVSLAINYSAKPYFSLFEEAKFYAKITYFNVVMISFIYMFKMFASKLELTKVFMRIMMFCGIFITSVMVVSILTGTALDSYPGAKIGYSGWFYAGNEIGAAIAIIFPFIVYYAIAKTTSIKELIFWIPVVLAGYSLIMLGTKVGYGALLLTLIVGLVSVIIAFFLKKIQLRSGSIASVVLILSILTVVLVTPYTPLTYNTELHIRRLEVNVIEKPSYVDEAYRNGEVNKVEDLILSGRQLFFDKHKAMYDAASANQKLFGMGYASNYEKEPKTIEIDYLDIFFSTGIIGTIIYFLPLLYFAVRALVMSLRKFSQILLPKELLLILSIMLGLGIAGFAGHVMTAPSVSIYLCAIIAYFYVYIHGSSKDF